MRQLAIWTTAALLMVLPFHVAKTGMSQGSTSGGASGVLIGRATDAVSGEAVRGVQVRVEALSPGALTNARGKYLFMDAPVGDHAIDFVHPCYLEVTVKATVSAAKRTRVDIGLPPDSTTQAGCEPSPNPAQPIPTGS